MGGLRDSLLSEGRREIWLSLGIADTKQQTRVPSETKLATVRQIVYKKSDSLNTVTKKYFCCGT